MPQQPTSSRAPSRPYSTYAPASGAAPRVLPPSVAEGAIDRTSGVEAAKAYLKSHGLECKENLHPIGEFGVIVLTVVFCAALIFVCGGAA